MSALQSLTPSAVTRGEHAGKSKGAVARRDHPNNYTVIASHIDFCIGSNSALRVNAHHDRSTLMSRRQHGNR